MSSVDPKEEALNNPLECLALSDGAGSPPVLEHLEIAISGNCHEASHGAAHNTTDSLLSGAAVSKDDPGRGIADTGLKPEKRQYHNSSLKTWKSPVVGGLSTSHENGTPGTKAQKPGLLYHMLAESHLHPKDPLGGDG